LWKYRKVTSYKWLGLKGNILSPIQKLETIKAFGLMAMTGGAEYKVN